MEKCTSTVARLEKILDFQQVCLVIKCRIHHLPQHVKCRGGNWVGHK